MPTLTHLRHKCIGCNSCVENASSNWKINLEDGKSNLKHSIKKGQFYMIEITADEIEINKKAAEDCPVNIIRLRK